MRKTVIFAAIFLLAPAALAASEPKITVEKIQPQPADPGDTVTVHLIVKNSGTSAETFEPLQVQTGEGITLLGRTSMKESFRLCGGCQKTGKFYLKVSEDTVSGSHPVEFHLTTGDAGIVENAIIDVDGRPNLVTSSGSLRVQQGGETLFNLTVANRGTDSSTQTVLTLTAPKMSFSPSKIFLEKIAPGETATEKVLLDAGENLESGPSSVETRIEYRDESRALVEKSSLSAYIRQNADITVSQLEIADAYIGEKTRVMVELENTGPGEAEKLSSKLSCKNAEVQDSKAFAGSLDSGESVPTVYHVIPNSGEVSCTVEISYIDSKEEQVTKSFEISASRKRTDMIPILGVLAVLLIGGTYYWRKKQE